LATAALGAFKRIDLPDIASARELEQCVSCRAGYCCTQPDAKAALDEIPSVYIFIITHDIFLIDLLFLWQRTGFVLSAAFALWVFCTGIRLQHLVYCKTTQRCQSANQQHAHRGLYEVSPVHFSTCSKNRSIFLS
jgi:hypothetical protein